MRYIGEVSVTRTWEVYVLCDTLPWSNVVPSRSYFTPKWINGNFKSWSMNSRSSHIIDPVDHIQKKLQSLATEVCLYKSWTSEVHLISKYLTNPEVSCLKSALNEVESELHQKKLNLNLLAKTEVKHESSAFSQDEVITEFHKRSPHRSSHQSSYEVKVYLEVLIEAPSQLEEWSHHSPPIHLPRFAKRRGRSGSARSPGRSSASDTSEREVRHCMMPSVFLWSKPASWKVLALKFTSWVEWRKKSQNLLSHILQVWLWSPAYTRSAWSRSAT